MCGLILAPASYSDAPISNALDQMEYRGDKKTGHRRIVAYGDWIMGHARLAIRDLTSAGNQPFTDKNSLIGFVGEIFNTVGNELDKLSWVLKDPYRFHAVDGFWAVAQIFGKSASIYTDHLGIKPLYYWPKYRIVCSEIEPMFALESRPPLDQAYLSNCIKWGYDYSGRTPYQGIVQIAPGQRLELTSESAQSQTYWDWARVPPTENLKEAVTEAIQNRLIGELPVALLLSGGLDSSIIYYVLKDMGYEVDCFSAENGESEFLPDGVKTLPLHHVTVFEAIQVMKAPLDLGSLIPQVQLARAVKEAGYNVCLTGDGADEIFGGYTRAMEYDSQYSDVFCELPYYHLLRLDRVMMASTIELRSPYLAPGVVAFGLRLPHRYYRSEKEALKFAFKGLVPEVIRKRKKHPLKTQAVIQGGIAYRQQLVEEFRRYVQEHY